MESAARVAGIADIPPPPDLESAPEPEPEHTTELDTTPPSRLRSNTTHTNPDRVPIPLAQRRSFSTGRHTPTASVRSRANSAFTARTLDLDDVPTVPPPPDLPDFNELPPSHASQPQPKPEQIGQAVTTAEDENGEDDGPPWDPLHPCWPHLNPHVPLSSPLYKSTRIIRLQRDYRLAGDLYPQYITSFPEILEPYLSQSDFSALIKELNTKLAALFKPSRKRHWVDSVLGLATGWLWDDAGLSAVKKDFRDVERWMEEWNKGPGMERGVTVIGLRRTAFLNLDLQVPDPSRFIVAEGANDTGVLHTHTNTNGSGTNGAVNGTAGYGQGHMNGYGPGHGEYSTTGPTTDGGTSIVGATTDGITDTDGRSFTTEAATDEAGGTSGYISGGSTSLRTSESFSRRRDQQAPRPEVPPIPREYLGEER